jgi:hypothetical protein
LGKRDEKREERDSENNCNEVREDGGDREKMVQEEMVSLDRRMREREERSRLAKES